MATMGMVSPEEWRKRTSLVLRRRSEMLEKVDKAYDAYYRLRFDDNKQKLHWA